MPKQPAIIIPEEREPSYLNRHLITGAKVGLIGALSATAAVATGGLSALGTTATIALALTGGALVTAGASAGCIQGKETIAHNQAQGRNISAPRLLNEGMLQGMLNGAILGLGAITLAAGTAALPWVAAAAAIGTAAIAYAQGNQHQTYMAAEYEAAKSKGISQERGVIGKAIDIAQGAGKAVGKTAEAAIDTVGAAASIAKVTAEESAELASKLKDGIDQTTDWREKIDTLEKQTEKAL